MPTRTGHAAPRKVVTELVIVLSVDANPVVTSGAGLIVQRFLSDSCGNRLLPTERLMLLYIRPANQLSTNRTATAAAGSTAIEYILYHLEHPYQQEHHELADNDAPNCVAAEYPHVMSAHLNTTRLRVKPSTMAMQ